MTFVEVNFSRLCRAAVIGLTAATAISACSSSGSTSAASSSSAQSLGQTCITDAAAPLALVIDARSNVPKLSLPGYLDALLEAAADKGRPISVIVDDGSPQVYGAPHAFSSNAANASARQQDLETYLNKYYLGPLLSGKYHAQKAETDVLKALDLAASAVGPGGNIIVIDSGLQTVAPLAYQQSELLTASPSDIVTFLRSQQLLPGLQGTHVELSGIGYTAAPQPALDEAQRNNLTAQWEAIVTAGGGCVKSDPTPNTAGEQSGLPPVSIVRPPTEPVFTNCGTIALADAGDVGFNVGQATYRDPAKAEAMLSRLASTLKQGSEHITLIGSTSSEGGDSVNGPLSLARAQAVQASLVALGIPGARIRAIGDGAHWEGRANDLGPGRVLLPGPAEQDREVIVQLPRCS